MPTAKGRLIVATPPMDDPNFERAVVLILQHDSDGAFGLVISRPADDVSVVEDGTLNAWLSRSTSPATLFEGGPVQQNTVLGLAKFDDQSERSWTSEVALGLRTIDLDSDATNALECQNLRLFIGYSGWGPLQLDGEIAAEHWFVVDARAADAFDGDPGTLWRRVLERDPAHRDWVRSFPDDPSLN